MTHSQDRSARAQLAKVEIGETLGTYFTKACVGCLDPMRKCKAKQFSIFADRLISVLKMACEKLCCIFAKKCMSLQIGLLLTWGINVFIWQK